VLGIFEEFYEMKRICLLAASFIFAAVFAVSASAQGGAQPAAGNLRIAVINTAAFAAKEGGITRYINALNALDAEVRPIENELQSLVTKYNNLAAEIKRLEDAARAPSGPPIDPNTARQKIEEYQTLELTIKRKQEDGKALYERREPIVLGPILEEISTAMQDYANQKGYDLIFDLAKIGGEGHLLVMTPKADVTKDFVAFFNARPARAATASAPR
jgi:Skp family chaperone for outer membrane proteins